VAQRGTSFTGIGNGDTGYTLDRFRFGEGGSPTYEVTVSQSSESPDGFASSIKYDVTTAQASLAASDQMRLDYFVEAQDLQQVAYGSSNPSTMTLSFYVRSNKTGTYVVYLSKDDDSRQQTHNYTINTADTWERKTITIVGDTTGAINNDNGRGIFIGWTLASGTTYTSGTASSTWEASTTANRAAGLTVNLADSTDNYWQITGVQLEVGSVATPFEHRSYGEELALCQRYYQRKSSLSGNYVGFATLGAITANTAFGTVEYIGTMRSNPSFNISNCGIYENNALRPINNLSTAYYGASSLSINITITSNVMAVGGVASLIGDNNANAYVEFEAEL
jgi:hypothetical protein